MNHVYRARELSDMCVPWVRVKVVPLKNKKGMGVSFTGKQEINVSDDMAKWNEHDLKYVVFHELAHNYLSAPHTKNKNHLMNPVINKGMSVKKIESDFTKIAKKSKVCTVRGRKERR